MKIAERISGDDERTVLENVITELGDLVTKNALKLRQFSGLNRQTRLENNLMVVRILDAARESAKTGKTVSLMNDSNNK